MNELLKELLPNPYMVDYQVPHDGRGFDLYDERKMIEYGQRIVRECANRATWAQDTGEEDIGGEVLKHFGVEE
jgi:hypothetical protein